MTASDLADLAPPRFIEAPARRVAGLARRYTMPDNAGIPGQWQAFTPWFGRVPGQVGMAGYGVCFNFDGCAFDYMAGVEVAGDADLPAGLTSVELPAGRYAVFEHTGHVSGITRTFDAIWRTAIPELGLTPAQAPAFEFYGERFDPATATGVVEIWVALA